MFQFKAGGKMLISQSDQPKVKDDVMFCPQLKDLQFTAKEETFNNLTSSTLKVSSQQANSSHDVCYPVGTLYSGLGMHQHFPHLSAPNLLNETWHQTTGRIC